MIFELRGYAILPRPRAPSNRLPVQYTTVPVRVVYSTRRHRDAEMYRTHRKLIVHVKTRTHFNLPSIFCWMQKLYIL